MRWRSRIGGLQSRSSIRIAGDRVYVGTCGTRWNASDSQDGVHCLDLLTGEQHWFAPTLADVNEIAVGHNSLIVPTDSGDVFILTAATGAVKRVFRADAAVLGRPVFIDGIDGWQAYFASASGQLYRIDQRLEQLTKLGSLGGECLAALLKLDADHLIAATNDGKIHRVNIVDGHVDVKSITRIPTSKYGARLGLSATPRLDGKYAYIGYARDTYYQAPAIAKLDLSSGQIEWFGRESSRAFGNVRATPLLVDDKLVVASAYTDGVQLLNPSNGSLIGEVRLGQDVFQHWSAPIQVGSHYVALGRVDGVCSIIDVRAERLVASISLATATTERPIGVSGQAYSEEPFALYPGEPAPSGAICATPAFSRGILVVGTTDGDIAAIDLNLEEDAMLE
jgi:outer membrane protein assembly factor BamB